MIKTLLLDFDGVIGSQRKYVGADGERVFLEVSSRDSGAIRRLRRRGTDVVIITACKSRLAEDYAKRHDTKLVVSNNKAATLDVMGIDWGSTICIADDVTDIPMMEKCFMALCPSDAHPKVKRQFESLEAPGGGGVVAEYEHTKHHDYVLAKTA